MVLSKRTDLGAVLLAIIITTGRRGLVEKCKERKRTVGAVVVWQWVWDPDGEAQV